MSSADLQPIRSLAMKHVCRTEWSNSVSGPSASGDAAPESGRFTGFDAPVFAGSRLIFHAAISGGTHGEGIFRIASSPQPPPVPVEALAWLGGPAPDGGSFVAFGDPAGNTAGNVALTADLSGSAVPRAILVFP